MKPPKRSRKPTNKASPNVSGRAKKKQKTTGNVQIEETEANNAVYQDVSGQGQSQRATPENAAPAEGLRQAVQPSQVSSRGVDEGMFQRARTDTQQTNKGRVDQRGAGEIPTSGPSDNADRSMGTFMSSDSEHNFHSSIGNHDNNFGHSGNLQINTAPSYTMSMFDPVGTNIPLKMKEKIWAGDFIELNSLLKSSKDLANDSQYNGDLVVKGGQLSIIQQRSFQIKNIHTWTSAYMVYMGVMLEKWPNKGQEYLKYMYNVRLAAERGLGTGWVTYDEQYRLRKARFPFTSWGDIDMELWLLYVATSTNVNKGFPINNNNPAETGNNYQKGATFPAGKRGFQGNQNQGNQRMRTCWGFNEGNCKYGKSCKFPHKCSNCFGYHPHTNCKA